MPRDEFCPITRSLDVFGDRWGLLVVRELLRGVSRFNELERSLPGISRSTLAQRLRHLIVRERVGLGGSRLMRMASQPIGLISFVMTRKMLLGIKERAERTRARSVAAPVA